MLSVGLEPNTSQRTLQPACVQSYCVFDTLSFVRTISFNPPGHSKKYERGSDRTLPRSPSQSEAGLLLGLRCVSPRGPSVKSWSSPWWHQKVLWAFKSRASWEVLRSQWPRRDCGVPRAFLSPSECSAPTQFPVIGIWRSHQRTGTKGLLTLDLNLQNSEPNTPFLFIKLIASATPLWKQEAKQ